MADYTIRSHADRLKIQSLWEAGTAVKDIADAVAWPASTLYAELKRGQDGTRLPNKRLRYDADLAQLKVQQAFERRGRKSAGA